MLREAIGFHDNPAASPKESRTLASLVRAAHVIVTDPIEGWNDIPPSEEDEEVLAELELHPDDLDDIRSLLKERVKELAPLFA